MALLEDRSNVAHVRLDDVHPSSLDTQLPTLLRSQRANGTCAVTVLQVQDGPPALGNYYGDKAISESAHPTCNGKCSAEVTGPKPCVCSTVRLSAQAIVHSKIVCHDCTSPYMCRMLADPGNACQRSASHPHRTLIIRACHDEPGLYNQTRCAVLARRPRLGMVATAFCDFPAITLSLVDAAPEELLFSTLSNVTARYNVTSALAASYTGAAVQVGTIKVRLVMLSALEQRAPQLPLCFLQVRSACEMSATDAFHQMLPSIANISHPVWMRICALAGG